jgi:hypothetical protein
VIAAAILDRLLHHSITINIKGASYRLREKLKAGLLKPKLGADRGSDADAPTHGSRDYPLISRRWWSMASSLTPGPFVVARPSSSLVR